MGLFDDKAFLSCFGKVKIFYSTPLGDHKDGGSRLFVLPAQDETAYLPVFTSTERAMERVLFEHLFDYLEKKMEVQGCNHTLEGTLEFLSNNSIPEMTLWSG